MVTVKALAAQNGYDNGAQFGRLDVLLSIDGTEKVVGVKWDGETIADTTEALRLLADRLDAEYGVPA